MRTLWISVILTGVSTLCFAQATGAPAGGGAAGGGGATTGGGATPAPGGSVGGSRTPTMNIPTDPRQQMPQMPQTFFLSGKVMLDDGTAPSDPVTIERVCGGNPRPEGYTDSKGRFSFQLGQRNNGMLPDASSSNGDGMGDPFGSSNPNSRMGGNTSMSSMGGTRINLMGCELRAVLPGYQSSIVSLANRNSMDNPDVGTIILKRMGNREGSVFSATNAFAPKDAKKAMDKGRELLKKGKVDDAQKELAKAVEIYPKYSSAWFELGKIQEEKGNAEEARKNYAQSLAADPKYVYPYRNLYMMSVKEQKWDDVADTTARLLKLNPFDFPDALYFNAISNFNLKKFDEAEKSAKSLYDQDHKKFARAGYVLGLVLAQKEDFPAAATHLKNYLEVVPNATDQDTVRKQLAEIEKFASGNRQ